MFLIAGGIMTILSVSSDTCFHTRSLAEPLPDDTNPTLSYKQKHQRNFLLHMHGDSLLADPDWKQMVTAVNTLIPPYFRITPSSVLATK